MYMYFCFVSRKNLGEYLKELYFIPKANSFKAINNALKNHVVLGER